MAQWIRRETTNLEIAGSSPAGDALYKARRDRVAQWIARWTSNPEVAGSSPVSVVLLLYIIIVYQSVIRSYHGGNTRYPSEL